MSAERPARELLRLDITSDEYATIRNAWKRHSIAEDEHDIAGLLATLTEDCVYEVFPGGQRWHGHEGAEQFYVHLLSAFPDITFDLTSIVIGPQGVFEEAIVRGTHLARWFDLPASGKLVEFTVLIFFPWDRERRKFRGERVYYYFGNGESGIGNR